ncbi:Small G protein signaling modulator 3 [Blomia tropicalis]|nr:Small G protein signaling modulator 3 [Blomia tropicalis]
MYSGKLEYGAPFCHLNRSLLPDNVLNQLNDVQLQQRYDEYGFMVETSQEITQQQKDEYKQTKERWTKILETYHQKQQQMKQLKQQNDQDEKNDDALNCDMKSGAEQIDRSMPGMMKLLSETSITNEHRPFFWTKMSESNQMKMQCKFTYTQLCELSNDTTVLTDQQAIQVLPNNVCFQSIDLPCVQRMKRILACFRWWMKINLDHREYRLKQLKEKQDQEDHNNKKESEETIKVTLNHSLIVAYLLLICNEEDTFWLLVKLNRDTLIESCCTIVRSSLAKCVPSIEAMLRRHDIDLDLIVTNWFTTLYAGMVNDTYHLFRIWDLLFMDGPIALVEIAIGMLVIDGRRLQKYESDSAQLFNALSDLPSMFIIDDQQQQQNSDIKIGHAWKTGKNIVDNMITLPIESESLFFDQNSRHRYIQLQQKFRRNSSQDCAQTIDEQKQQQQQKIDTKNWQKNVKQTNILMSLHDSIVSIAYHFQSYDLKVRYNLEPNFTESTPKIGTDCSTPVNERPRPFRRRARALLDFDACESDELAFHQNEIITIKSERDEHCWIGELNGNVGWFPAKFVELINERDRDYTIAGDDRVIPFANDLIRGRFCSAMKAIFSHDLHRQSYFVAIHPWMIIEQIAEHVSNSGQFKQIYSRLVLTRTFRLDEHVRILTPAELLYRSIVAVNHSHVNVPMDVKFRSLIIHGLNQYVLHDWFQLICTSYPPLIGRFYGANSFLCNPVWKLIYAELKLLLQFSFHLNPDAEIDYHQQLREQEIMMKSNGGSTTSNTNVSDQDNDDDDDDDEESLIAVGRQMENIQKHQQQQQPKSPVTKEGIWDMLIKYHLFSWDI